MSISIAPLFSGSGGNCIYIEGGETGILVDVGCSCTRIEAELGKIGRALSNVRAILVTHEHTDHISDIGSVSRKHDVPVYANEPTWMEIIAKTGEIKKKNMRVIDSSDFYINGLCVQPFNVPHDAARPFGYSVSAGGKKISVMTDIGRATEEALACAEGSGIVLLESNYDVNMLKNSRYPYPLKQRILSSRGHLSNNDAAGAALRLFLSGVRGILLGHISENNNDYSLALKTVSEHLGRNGVVSGRHVALGVAKREGVTGFYAAK